MRNDITNTRSLVAGVTVAFTILCAQAEDNDTHLNLFSLSLDQLINVKISGSTLTDEPLINVPSAVTVFNREQIKRLGLGTLAELMNLVPGYQVLRSADNSAYSMASSRARRTDAVSAEILLIVDGNRTQATRHGGSSIFLEMPINNIERVEFIRGPGSAIYGSNAMMGVVNIVTVKNHNELSVAAGGEGNKNLSLIYGVDGETFDFDMSVNLSDSSGQDYLVTDAYTNIPVSVRDPNTGIDAIVNLTYGDLSLQLYNRTWSVDDFFVLESVNEEYNRVKIEYTRASLAYQYNNANLSSTTRFHIVDNVSKINSQVSAYNSFTLISTPSSEEPLAVRSNSIADELSIENNNNLEIDDDNQLGFGISWRKENIDSLDTYTNFDYIALNAGDYPITYDPEFIWFPTNLSRIESLSSYAAHTQWITKPSEKNSFTLGLRYDNYKEIAEENVSPRLAWVHNFNTRHTLKLLYGTAFRAPTLSMLNADTTFSRSERELKAETVSTTEIIWLGNFNSTTLVKLGYFNSSFRDAILLEAPEDDQDASRILVNSYHGPIQGIELELDYHINTEWTLRGTASYIFEKDDITFRESGKLASMEINYTSGKWNANIALAYRNEREGLDGTEAENKIMMDAYWLSFAKLQYALNDKLQFYSRINNVADDIVYYPSPGSRLPEGIPSRGREFELGINLNF